MLEKIDSRVDQIEARKNGSSAFGSASEPPIPPAEVPNTVPRGQGSAMIGRVVSEHGGGLILNELGGSGFGEKSVFKGRADNTPIGRQLVYKSPNLAPPGAINIPKLMVNKFTGEEQYASLGTGFKQWGYTFLEAIEMAEIQSQFAWGERLNAN
uniref:RxLR effector candidate protein n=1 Tax=Hyaloperonospora arabidopsidis (strain Emoy2) TaxID=559515 RepID=M4BE52_HYAAE